MNIYYQGEPGSYSHLASMEIAKNLSVEPGSIVGLVDFDGVWEKISLGNVGVLPIENSYAGSIHHNVYNFLNRDNKIIGEYNFEVHHCLLSLENDISNISEVYSHPQALSQTYKYSKEHGFMQKPFGDTAGAAKMIHEKQKRGVGAIASRLAGELYKLNILDENIQDQSGNTTKFLIVVPKSDNQTEFSIQKGRTTLLLKTNHSAGSLHTCLGVFAKRSVNMTKIESIPLGQGHFSYAFWITIEGTLLDHNNKESIKELEQMTDFVKILGEY